MAKKTDDILSELNKNGGHWIVANGVHALTQVTKSGESFNFNPASGILIKVFFNTENGEIKLFPAAMIDNAF